MNVLFIGSTTSVFCTNMAYLLNQNERIEVDAVLSSNEISKNKNYLDKYAHVLSYEFSNDFKIPKVNGLINTIRLILKLLTVKKYDIIHLQSIDNSILYLMPVLKYKSNKIISTVWGSDFNKCKNINYFRLILKYSDLITCTNDNFKNRLELVVNNRNKKILTLPGILQILFELDKLQELSKQQIKTNLGFAPEKIIVGCGTNLRKMQHHLEIIDQIGKNKNKFTKPILILIQMTYGETDKLYLDEIINKLKSFGIEYTILSRSLTDKEMAMVRRATDILIQVQDHDQFSGAMLETLYAENIVITGSWLQYSIMDTEGVYYFKIEKLSDLSDILLHCVNNYDELVKNTRNNPKKLSKIFQPYQVVNKWASAYENLIS